MLVESYIQSLEVRPAALGDVCGGIKGNEPLYVVWAVDGGVTGVERDTELWPPGSLEEN